MGAPTSFASPTFGYGAVAPTTFANIVPTTVNPIASSQLRTASYEPMAYSAQARVPSVAMGSYGSGKDLKAGGRVVSERPISREELYAHGNLSETMAESHQSVYSGGFGAGRAAPVAFEQSAFIGSGRQSYGTVPRSIG